MSAGIMAGITLQPAHSKNDHSRRQGGDKSCARVLNRAAEELTLLSQILHDVHSNHFGVTCDLS